MHSGPPVLFLHGIRTSASMWRAQLEALDGRGIRAVAIDLPGHGTRMGEPFTVDAAIAAIDAAIDDLGEPVLLVGLSMGGYIGMHYAATHPHRLHGLVAASCGAIPRPVFIGGYRAVAAAIHRLPDRGSALNDGLARLLVPETGVSDLLGGGIALEVMQSGLQAIGTLRPLEDLAAYDGPVRLVNGRYDHIRFDERRMLRASRHGSLVIIPRATHLASLVQPAAFTEVVLAAWWEFAAAPPQASPTTEA
ncbi:MAG: alpha/beta fold hydrolase [Leifsonia sp.]